MAFSLKLQLSIRCQAMVLTGNGMGQVTVSRNNKAPITRSATEWLLLLKSNQFESVMRNLQC